MNPETFFRLGALITLAVGAGISIYFRRKADRQGNEKITFTAEGLVMTLSLRILGLLGWGGIFAYLINPACMDNREFLGEIENDLAEGIAAGVTGTPGFFINGFFVSGAQPFEVFEQVIEAELKK